MMMALPQIGRSAAARHTANFDLAAKARRTDRLTVPPLIFPISLDLRPSAAPLQYSQTITKTDYSYIPYI